MSPQYNEIPEKTNLYAMFGSFLYYPTVHRIVDEKADIHPYLQH
jgi:hypothetical protein